MQEIFHYFSQLISLISGFCILLLNKGKKMRCMVTLMEFFYSFSSSRLYEF